MQYAIYDKASNRYYCEDGTWVQISFANFVGETENKIQLYRDDDKAIAKISELEKNRFGVDFTLHGFDHETVYFIVPVGDKVLEKVHGRE